MIWTALGIRSKSNEKPSLEDHSISNVRFNMLQSAELKTIIANFVGIMENQLEFITHTSIIHAHIYIYVFFFIYEPKIFFAKKRRRVLFHDDNPSVNVVVDPFIVFLM